MLEENEDQVPPQCHKECRDLWLSDPAAYPKCSRSGEEEDDFEDHPLNEEADEEDIEPVDYDYEIDQIQQKMKKIKNEKERLLAFRNQITQRNQEADQPTFSNSQVKGALQNSGVKPAPRFSEALQVDLQSMDIDGPKLVQPNAWMVVQLRDNTSVDLEPMLKLIVKQFGPQLVKIVRANKLYKDSLSALGPKILELCTKMATLETEEDVVEDEVDIDEQDIDDLPEE